MKLKLNSIIIFGLLFQFIGITQSDNKKVIIQDLCWSPENNYIYFSAMKVNPDYSDYSPKLWTIYRYDIKNKSSNVIATSSLYVSVLNSNGDLTFSKRENEKSCIYTSDKNGLNQIKIIGDSLKNSAPTCSPDGKLIAFNRTTNDIMNIYSVNVKSRELKQLTHFTKFKPYNPVWSPNGKHITYYLEKGDGKDQIHIMDADGANDKNITNDSFNNIFPGWIDNNTIIYGRAKKHIPTKTFQIDIDGTNKKQILNIESFYARFSTDKTKIAYVNNDEGKIYVVSLKGETLFKIEVPD